jgi:hypothetical protein
MDSIYLAEDRGMWWTSVKVPMHLWVAEMQGMYLLAEEFVTSQGLCSKEFVGWSVGLSISQLVTSGKKSLLPL